VGWGVYLIQSTPTGDLYTGVTNNPERRVQEHNESNCKGAKRTRRGRPWVLAYWEPCESKTEALRREYRIKQMSRRQKLSIVQGCR
jgi:putative endonuclease